MSVLGLKRQNGGKQRVENDAHQEEGQEGKRGRPDTRVYRKYSEALQNVWHTCSPAFRRVLLATWHTRAYPVNPVVVVPLRRSKNIMKIAIRTSTPAEIERHEMPRSCPPSAEVVGSKQETYAYPEVMVIEHSEPSDVHARSQ